MRIILVIFLLLLFNTKLPAITRHEQPHNALFLYSTNKKSVIEFQKTDCNSSWNFCSFLANTIQNEFHSKLSESDIPYNSSSKEDEQRLILFLLHFCSDANKEKEPIDSYCFRSNKLEIYKYPHASKTFIIHAINKTVPDKDIYLALSSADLKFLHSVWCDYFLTSNNNKVDKDTYESHKSILENASLFLMFMDVREYFIQEAYYKTKDNKITP